MFIIRTSARGWRRSRIERVTEFRRAADNSATTSEMASDKSSSRAGSTRCVLSISGRFLADFVWVITY